MPLTVFFDDLDAGAHAGEGETGIALTRQKRMVFALEIFRTNIGRFPEASFAAARDRHSLDQTREDTGASSLTATTRAQGGKP